MAFTIRLVENGESFSCGQDKNVLEGMFCLGKKGIPTGCRGGGCGVCKVKVLQGDYHTRPMSACHVSKEDLAQGIVLACRIYPKSDLDIRVLGQMKQNVLHGKLKNQLT